MCVLLHKSKNTKDEMQICVQVNNRGSLGEDDVENLDGMTDVYIALFHSKLSRQKWERSGWISGSERKVWQVIKMSNFQGLQLLKRIQEWTMNPLEKVFKKNCIWWTELLYSTIFNGWSWSSPWLWIIYENNWRTIIYTAWNIRNMEIKCS